MRAIGRYVLHDEIASGGMATVHLGRLLGAALFARTVAIKRLHPHYAKDPEFVSMFLDEARLAARIRHPNVVATVDVVSDETEGELFLVMEYVQGESLARLIRPTRDVGVPVPPPIALGVIADGLHGLHGAHEARDESGAPLEIVHRDISPHNLIVGVDGITRVLDFGIAKATSRITNTRDGQLKGKVAYMAPEQLSQRPIDRRTDVFAASIVLWEMLTGERLFFDDDVGTVMSRVLSGDIRAPGISPELDAIVMRGLARDPAARYPDAKTMAHALEALGPARASQIGAWVESLAGEALRRRSDRIAEIERDAKSEAPARLKSATEDVPTQMLLDAAPVAAAPVVVEPPPPKSRRGLAALVAFVALLGAGAMVAMWHRSSASPAPEAPAPSASPVFANPPTTSASAAPIATPTTTPPIASSTKPTPAHPPKKPPVVPKIAKPSCDPPFFIDDQGVKRFKPGCV